MAAGQAEQGRPANQDDAGQVNFALSGGDAPSSSDRRRRPSDDLVQAFHRRAARALDDLARGLGADAVSDLVAAPTSAAFLARLLERVPEADTAALTDPLAAARMRGVAAKRALIEQEGGAIGAAQMGEILGITPEAVRKRLARNRLFALPYGDRLLFPMFQLGEHGVLQGVDQVLDAFEIEDPWMRANFMLTPDPRLGGERPIDALRRGNIEPVVTAARAFGSHGGG